MRQPKPLSELVLAALPLFAEPPTVTDMCAKVHSDPVRVRAAYDALEASGRAKIVRRGNGLHLLPASSPVRVCPVCRGEVTGNGRTCSKSCGMRVAWTKRDRAKQGEIFRATHKRHPEMRTSFSSLRDNPAHRQFVADRNRKDWADPVKKMKRVISMEAAWKGPKAEGRIAKARDKKLSLWSDPEWKERTIEAMRTGTRGRYQRAAIQLVSDGATDEEIAFKTGRTMEQTKMLLRRLFKLGKINRAPVEGRKMRPVRPKRSAHV